jgi:hypothetical protein
MQGGTGIGGQVMATLTRRKDDQVIWMADCYDLAKRFPNPHTWLSLLEPLEQAESDLNPFHYWLWMEIWKAAQDIEESA